MTEQLSNHFTQSVLPGVQKEARNRKGESADPEDDEADFVAASWEVFVNLARHMPQPELRHVLTTMAARSQPSVQWPKPGLLSLSLPAVRKRVEAIPA